MCVNVDMYELYSIWYENEIQELKHDDITYNNTQLGNLKELIEFFE